MAGRSAGVVPEEVELQPLAGSGGRSSTQEEMVPGTLLEENVWGMLQIINRIPVITRASSRFPETSSSLGQGLASLLDEGYRYNFRNPSRDGEGASTSSSQVRHSAGPLVGNSSLSAVQDLRLEKATEFLNSTGTMLAEYKERFFNMNSPRLWQGMVDRIQTTWRGSVDDVGWLQKISGGGHSNDQTGRFEQILELVCHGVHRLPNNLLYLLVPGLFSNYGPLYFTETREYFSKLGLTCHIAKIHSEAAVETNANVLKEYIEELYWGSGKQVAILGHSKGGVDAAAAIAMHWPDLKDKVMGLVLAQSPYGGTPVAADILREGQIADVQTRYLIELLMQKFVKGDIRALEDLTYTKRKHFLAKHPLPPDFPVVSFHTEVSIGPSVMSMMSHIAHAELPWQGLNKGAGRLEDVEATPTKLPVVVPLPAVMALCAKHIELRYNHKSDGLVVREDAEAPGSVVVRPKRNLDHAWMVYSSSGRESKEPTAPQMCEALLVLLLEICKKAKAD